MEMRDRKRNKLALLAMLTCIVCGVGCGGGGSGDEDAETGTVVPFEASGELTPEPTKISQQELSTLSEMASSSNDSLVSGAAWLIKRDVDSSPFFRELDSQLRESAPVTIDCAAGGSVEVSGVFTYDFSTNDVPFVGDLELEFRNCNGYSGHLFSENSGVVASSGRSIQFEGLISGRVTGDCSIYFPSLSTQSQADFVTVLEIVGGPQVSSSQLKLTSFGFAGTAEIDCGNGLFRCFWNSTLELTQSVLERSCVLL